MDEQHDEASVERGVGPVAPIFRLLGEGWLGREAVDAVLAVLEAEPLPTVSEARMTRACQIAYRTRPIELQRGTTGIRGAFRQLRAALALDLRPWGNAVGVRGGALTGCRLLFTVDGYEVVIQESRDAKRRARSLLGQILRDGDPVPGAAVLLASATQRFEAKADQEGNFRFQNVEGGSYQLDVRAAADLIVCAPVTLDDRAVWPART